MQKILAFTGIRSDYDLLSPLYELLHADPEIDFRLIVAGAHLSPSFGLSVRRIEKDGFPILSRIETLIDGDSRTSRIKSASILLQCSIDAVAGFNPDLIIYPGDREDVIVGGLIAGYLGIPGLHFYGGDHVQDSHIDNPVRHATSKLSTAHFVSIPEHKQRLMKTGEPEFRIFTVGNLSVDRFVAFAPLEKEAIRLQMEMENFPESHAVMIFHPVAEEEETAPEYVANILESLKEKGIFTFVSYPNADPGNKAIVTVMQKYELDPNFKFYRNLDRDIFLSLYKRADFIIGNSSSGIIEAASIPIPTINVGFRQTGRLSGHNVIYCKPDPESIGAAIVKALSPEFKQSLKGMKNPYGNGSAARKSLEIIKNTDFKAMIYKNEDALDL